MLEMFPCQNKFDSLLENKIILNNTRDQTYNLKWLVTQNK